MHRHYLQTSRLTSGTIALTRDEARHLRTVLRICDGEVVELFDGRGLTMAARVVASDRQGLRLEAVAEPVRHAPHACAVTLWTCICKGKRMDWTVEKAVELGAARIVPVISSRTIVRLDDEDTEGKSERWTRVAVEAARQCGAAWLPAIDAPTAIADVGPSVRACAPVFVAALVPTAQPMRAALARLRAAGGTPARAGWFVGPEGDFTHEELRLLLDAGAIPVNLGRQVLRAETAAVWGLCLLGAEWL